MIIDVPGHGQIDFPDTMTDDQIVSAIKGLGVQAPAESIDPTAGMTALERFNAGMGAGVTDLALGGKQALTEYGNTKTLGQMLSPQQQMTLGFSGYSNRLGQKLVPDSAVADVQAEVDAKRKLDSALMDTTSGKVGNIAGNVLAAIPASMLPGANTLTGSAIMGGGMGLLQPTAEGESRALNTLVGSGAGAAGYGLSKIPGKIAQVATKKVADIEAKVSEKAAAQAAAETASAKSASGNAAQNAYRQLEHLRELNAKGLLSEEGRIAAEALERELAEKAAEKLLPAAAQKASTAKAYQEALETEAERATKLAAEKLSGKEAMAQVMARVKRYGPAAVGGIIGNTLFPGLGGSVGGAATGLVLRPALRSMMNLTRNPAVQRGALLPLTELGLLSNPVTQTVFSTGLPAGLLNY